MNNLRTVRRQLPNGDTEIVKMEDLHKGDIFTMSEHGVPVGTLWCAVADGEFDEKLQAGSIAAKEIVN